MKYLHSLSCRVGTWLCVLAGACCVFGGNAIAAQAIAKPAQGGEVWLAASNKTLDGMRGGFDIGAGLTVSFGVVRSIAINGNLLVTTSFNIADLSKITPVQAAFINQQVGALNLIQNGPGNTVQPAATPATVATATGPVSPGTPSPSSANSASPTSVTLGTATLSTAPFNGAAFGTFIQNTLNNQNIQNQTVINTSTNSLSMLKGMNWLNTLNSALSSAFGSR
ncbi:hypothetical protein [Polaromonas sp. C04]|uniref:hypothetical protein n=1 Tax=Polaromonas sp. C04 TaxID=1945857 RepID=UPI001185F222|nr:hypothetical protein [Polaromonas sp. C04]